MEDNAKKKPNRTRNNSVLIRLTDEEKMVLENKSAQAGMKINEFIIHCINEQKIKVVHKPHGEEILSQLRGIGTNMNRLARFVNSNHGIPAEHIDKTMETYQEALQKLIDLQKEWSNKK